MKNLAAVLVLLAVVGVGRAGEKDIIERLRKAGIQVARINIDHENDVLFLEGVNRNHSDVDLAELCELHHMGGWTSRVPA
jgi:3-hydroxyisobutyrate dehydrogenase-like beta-hydroxyacid dehydrogenase